MKPHAQTLSQWANQGILRAALILSASGLLVKVVATCREFVAASLYGRSDAMDAFLVAILLPNLLVNLIAESMNQALIPTLVRVRELEGSRAAQRLLNSSFLLLCTLLVAACLLMALAARFYFPLLAANFSAEKLALARQLFYMLLPMVVLMGIASNATAVLNLFERFAAPALVPAVTPLVTIAGILFFGQRYGIWAMAYATLAGVFVHALLVVIMMERHGYHLRLVWHGADDALREVAHQYGPVLASGLLASSGLLVDQAMAAMLAPGSVSSLVYANRYVSVVMTLLAGALSSAVVPYFSELVAHRDWAGCRQTLHTWLWRSAWGSVPFALLLMAASGVLLRLTLEHGVFTANDTASVLPVLLCSAIQIPFYAISRIDYRFIVTMRRTDLIFYCGGLNLLLDVVLNLLLMRLFGVAGIALATSLWTVSTFIFLRCAAHHLLRRAERLQL